MTGNRRNPIPSLLLGVALSALGLVAVAPLSPASAGTPVGTGPTLGDPSPEKFIAMGQVRMRSFANSSATELMDGVSANAPVSVGLPVAFGDGAGASDGTATQAEVDLGNSMFTGGTVGSYSSGDCTGAWAITNTTALNRFSWTWSASADTLTLVVTRPATLAANSISCTVVYAHFAAALQAEHPNWGTDGFLGVSERLAQMNTLRILVRGSDASTTRTVTVSELKVDGSPSAGWTVGPASYPAADKQVSSYDFDSGGSFTVSGRITGSGDFSGCRNECLVQLTMGHVSAAPADNGDDVSGAVSGAEGSALAVSGGFTDPDGDPLVITQTAGPGSLVDNGDGTWSWAFFGVDDASGSVTVSANDGWGNSATHTFAYSVTNVAPTITGLAGSPNPALVGTPVTWAGTASDPGTADTVQWSFDGGAPSAAAAATVTYGVCGTKTMTAVATDDDGGVSAPVTATVRIEAATVLPPLRSGTENLVQRGQVVPVKVAVGCEGVTRTDLAPAIRLATRDVTGLSDAAADTDVPVSVSSADSAGVMRLADGFYLYNLKVPNSSDWPAGKELTVLVYPFGTTNGSVVPVVLQLRK